MINCITSFNAFLKRSRWVRSWVVKISCLVLCDTFTSISAPVFKETTPETCLWRRRRRKKMDDDKTCDDELLHDMSSHVDSSYRITFRDFTMFIHFFIEMQCFSSIAANIQRLQPYIKCLNMGCKMKADIKTECYLSANSISDFRNLLLRRSLSSGSFGSTGRTSSLRNNNPLSWMPRASPILGNSCLFLKLICESRGWWLEMEKKTMTRIPAYKKHNLTLKSV